MAEVTVSKTVQCGFESRPRHMTQISYITPDTQNGTATWNPHPGITVTAHYGDPNKPEVIIATTGTINCSLAQAHEVARAVASAAQYVFMRDQQHPLERKNPIIEAINPMGG